MNIRKSTFNLLLAACCSLCLCLNTSAQNGGNGNAYGWENGNGNAYGWGNGNAYGWQNNAEEEENRLIGEYEELIQNIEISQICFPDTVTIGDTVVLCGYVVNKNDSDFNNSLYVQYNIEDEMAESFTTDEGAAGYAGSTEVIIPANDSLAFDIPVEVTESNFRVNSYDVVVVWPIGPSLLTDSPKHTETYVKGASANKNAATNILKNSNYELYPNPVSDYFTVKASNDENTAIQKIEIFNTVGQNILEQTYKNSTSYVSISLPSHTLAGMYYLHITDVNNQSFVEQLIVH